jgi:type IV secretory pathway TraG/TraD family ATPase VirD4
LRCHGRSQLLYSDRPPRYDFYDEQGIVGEQTKGQFHRLYGQDGTQALFTGLATQIVYGGCDVDTADFYSGASGTTTVDANPDPAKANLRQRPLLTVDEIITPLDGNCTVFARYVEATFATQVIMTAQLTRLYERDDWKRRFATTQDAEPLVLARSQPLSSFTPLAPHQLTRELAATKKEVVGRGFSAEKYANTLTRTRREP